LLKLPGAQGSKSYIVIGAVITLFAVTGLTHKQAYKDIFVITLTNTAAVFAIAVYYATGLY
jgi:H+/gluconate symporter-like permease